jgi:hypothetical protein
MITKTFGPTTVNVCEDTAKCIVHTPVNDTVNLVADYIDKNNFTVLMIYGSSNSTLALKRQVGGYITEDYEQAKELEKTLC